METLEHNDPFAPGGTAVVAASDLGKEIIYQCLSTVNTTLSLSIFLFVSKYIHPVYLFMVLKWSHSCILLHSTNNKNGVFVSLSTYHFLSHLLFLLNSLICTLANVSKTNKNPFCFIKGSVAWQFQTQHSYLWILT